MALGKPTVASKQVEAKTVVAEVEVETVTETQTAAEAANVVESEVIEAATTAATEEEVLSGAVVEGEVVEQKTSVAEVEAEQKSAEPIAEEKQVAAPKTNVPAARAEANIKEFKAEMADQGIEGLTIDGFSFPTIVLPGEGKFQLKDDEDSDLGTEFNFQILQSKERFVFRADADDEDAEFFMSYDPNGKTKTDGSCTAALLEQWAADSGEERYKPSVKRYLDATVTVLDGELADEVCQLQIPGNSSSRLSGQFLKMKMKKIAIGEGVVTAKVGKKVKKGQNAFYPWAFSLNENFDG